LKICLNADMKPVATRAIMAVVRTVVRATEKLFKIRITRFPLEKFYEEFIDLANFELISQARGILHIGAHFGLESESYSKQGKPVIFIEADPDTFQELQKNVRAYENQTACNLLLGDQEKIVKFFRSSNGSQSSSVFSFSSVNRFRSVSTIDEIDLTMHRLDSAFSDEELRGYDHWIVDVQGAELLVLVGAGKLIDQCRTMLIECSTEEFYSGGAHWNQIRDFLQERGFKYLIAPNNISHLNIIFFRCAGGI
jgi:FkbM family methyltransferase